MNTSTTYPALMAAMTAKRQATAAFNACPSCQTYELLLQAEKAHEQARDAWSVDLLTSIFA